MTLTFDLVTWFLLAKHRLVMAKLLLNLIIQDEIMGRTRFWNTQTNKREKHSHGQGMLYMPFRPPFHGGGRRGIKTNNSAYKYHIHLAIRRDGLSQKVHKNVHQSGARACTLHVVLDKSEVRHIDYCLLIRSSLPSKGCKPTTRWNPC